MLRHKIWNFVIYMEKMKRANAMILTRERRMNEKMWLRNRFTDVSHVNRAGLDFSSRLSGT